MQIDFNVMNGVCKMLEVIDRSDKARKFAYFALILAFVFAMSWIAPNLLKAIADFILTIKQT